MGATLQQLGTALMAKPWQLTELYQAPAGAGGRAQVLSINVANPNLNWPVTQSVLGGYIEQIAVGPVSGDIFMIQGGGTSSTRLLIHTRPNGQVKYTYNLHSNVGAYDPQGLVVDPTETYLYITMGHAIVRYDIAAGTGSVWAGALASSGNTDATDTTARFNDPIGIALTSDGATMFVACYGYNTIRKIVVSSVTVSTVAGNSGGTGGHTDNATGTSALLYYPAGLAITADDSMVYFSEGPRVRKMANSGTFPVTNVAGPLSVTYGSLDGTGTAARFNGPRHICLSGDETHVLVADRTNHLFRKVNVSSGLVTTILGTGSSAYLTTDSMSTVNFTPTQPRFVSPTAAGADTYYVGEIGATWVYDPMLGTVRYLFGPGGSTPAAVTTAMNMFARSAPMVALFLADSDGLRSTDKILTPNLTVDLDGSVSWRDSIGMAQGEKLLGYSSHPNIAVILSGLEVS